jgi:murein DD-endopeptidase MepM/ murein hydrolase activator NlpD
MPSTRRSSFDTQTVGGLALCAVAGGAVWALSFVSVALVLGAARGPSGQADARAGRLAWRPRDAPGSAHRDSPSLSRALLFPVAGAPHARLGEGFHAMRAGNTRLHEALDIAAPRGTPVLAATAGRIGRLAHHAKAGLTVEQSDASGRYCLVYAHLSGYAPGLRDGSWLARGQVVGYVGSSGNARQPHLHFAVRLRRNGACWNGRAMDPAPLFAPPARQG